MPSALISIPREELQRGDKIQEQLPAEDGYVKVVRYFEPGTAEALDIAHERYMDALEDLRRDESYEYEEEPELW